MRAGFPDQWSARFPAARLIVLAGAHHFPQMDEPVAVAEAIRTWHRDVIGVSRTAARADITR